MEAIKAAFSYGKATIHLEGGADEIQRCLESGAVSKHLMSAAAATKSASDNIDDETFERALDHAWGWFALHADHRMKSVNFFIITIAFLTAAFVTAIRFGHPLSGIGVSAAGLILTICFSRIEQRIRELLKASEEALKPLQDMLAKRTAIDAFKMLDIVEAAKKPFTRYSHVILALHLTAMAMFVSGALYALALHNQIIGPICLAK
jgi:hypothetical protein